MFLVEKLLIVLFIITTPTLFFKVLLAEATWEEVFWEDIKELEHNTTVLLVDVRRPSELEETGFIPGAINIPLSDLSTELTLSGTDFFKKYNRAKPELDKPIVFYCRTGRRSTEASNIALDLGYTNVKNYKGSWVDWAQHLDQAAKTLKN